MNDDVFLNVNDFKKWMKDQEDQEAMKAEKIDLAGTEVESKVNSRRLVENMWTEEGHEIELALDFRKNGGIVSTVTCRSEFVLEEFDAIAKIGGGEAFLTTNERQIMMQLMVLVFGSQHRAKVVEAFDLLNK